MECWSHLVHTPIIFQNLTRIHGWSENSVETLVKFSQCAEDQLQFISGNGD